MNENRMSAFGAPDDEHTAQTPVPPAQSFHVPPSQGPLPPVQANPWAPPPWAPGIQSPGNHSGFRPAQFVDELIHRGSRGELIKAPWFRDIRQRNADAFVVGTYAAGFVITVLLDVFASSMFTAIVVYALWIGLGYLYLALGTKLAHQFVKFGICLVAVIVVLMQFWSLLSAVALGRSLAGFVGLGSASMALLVFRLVLGILTAPIFVYVGLRVHRFVGAAYPSQPFTTGASYPPAESEPPPPASHFAQPPLQGRYPPPPPPTFPPAPPYGPYAPYVGARPTNSMAIAALVASLIVAPLGIVFGHISLSQIKRSGEDGRGLAIAGLVIGYVGTAIAVIGVAIFVAGMAALNSALDDFDSDLSTTSTTYETPVGTPSASDEAIKDAEVGDCIHKVTGASRGDGTSDATVSPATCGSSYATHRVTERTDVTSDCYDDWVQSFKYSPRIVLCLTEE